MDPWTIVGLVMGGLGLLIAIISLAVVLFQDNAARQRTMDRIDNEFRRFQQTADRLLSDTIHLIDDVKELRLAHQHLRPDLTFLMVAQWQFLEKLLHYRKEKYIVARKIARQHVRPNDVVLLDSGSTTDLVTSELLSCGVSGVSVYSNNLFAALHLVGTNVIDFHLLQGVFSERFAAVYSDEANSRLDQYPFGLFVLACTSIRFDAGPMVHADDRDNANFKRKLLELFLRSKSGRLVIAVDPTKFVESGDDKLGLLKPDDWQDAIRRYRDRIWVVTSPMPAALSLDRQAAIADELRRFREAGIRLDDEG